MDVESILARHFQYLEMLNSLGIDDHGALLGQLGGVRQIIDDGELSDWNGCRR